MTGENIKKIRKLRKLTQLELANLIGKRQGDISRWEKGDIIPTLCNIHLLARALSVNILELV